MNRCPKCDCDRFKTDKKGNLQIEKGTFERVNKETGEITQVEADAVVCSWCSHKLEMRPLIEAAQSA